MPYCLDSVVASTGLSRRCVAYHVRYLRESGLLAWAEHGTRRNILDRQPRQAADGSQRRYAGTATIYAACVPRPYDDHVGRVVRGNGYQARVSAVNEDGRRHEIALAKARTQHIRLSRRASAADHHRGSHRRPGSTGPSDSTTTLPTPVDNSEQEKGLCTPSRRGSGRRNGSGINGGKDTLGRVESRSSHVSHKREVAGTTGMAVQHLRDSIRFAEQVRDALPGLRYECLRRVAFVLRPWYLEGMGALEAICWLQGAAGGALTVRGRAGDPIGLIKAQVARRGRTTGGLAEMLLWQNIRPAPAVGLSARAAHQARLSRREAQAQDAREAVQRAREQLAETRRALRNGLTPAQVKIREIKAEREAARREHFISPAKPVLDGAALLKEMCRITEVERARDHDDRFRRKDW